MFAVPTGDAVDVTIPVAGGASGYVEAVTVMQDKIPDAVFGVHLLPERDVGRQERRFGKMGMLRRADIGCGRPRQNQERETDENRRQQAPQMGSTHSTPRR